MTDANENSGQETLGMSDEDFANLNTAFIDEAPAEEDAGEEKKQTPAAEAEGTPAGGDEGEGEPATPADGEEEEDAGAEGADESEDPDDSENEPEEGEEKEDKPDEGDQDEKDKKKDDGEDPDEKDDEPDTAAKAFFDKVTAPFKANGKEMQIKDAGDVVRLMQMGANYNKKMSALKPSLRLVKMLERNKLMDEDRLSFLIDLDKKDPTAIAKLIKDSDLDPMDLDLEEGQKYESSNKYSVDEREMALDETIEDLRDSPTFDKTLDVVSNKWDDKSRNIVANTPELMRVIDDHMKTGVYDVISTEVEKERTLGRLNGMTEIEAYRQIGDRLNEEGAFAHLFKSKEQDPAPKPEKPTKTADDAEARKAKRRAASPAKAAPSSEKKQDFNPLALSDEEYMKQTDNRFL